MKKACLFSLIVFQSISIISCGSSSSTINDSNKNSKRDKKITFNDIKEDFIITPYRTKINVPPKSNSIKNSYLNVWYGYPKDYKGDTTSTYDNSNVFRVQILATDNLEQAKRMQNRVLNKITQKNIYILFDPPFYKLQIGDFAVHSLAEDLEFKFKQLGYSDARIVRENIIINR